MLFLMDGDNTGRIKCTLPNWTGVVYKIPRTDLEKCRGREDLMQSGVYFLFGISDRTGEPVVYIGQAGVRKSGEGILCRLQEHKRNPDKDYWNEAVVFTTSNNSFGPTEISYLESRFTAMAKATNRYEIKNGNEPTLGGRPTEEKESELEEFIDFAKIAIGSIGHRVFEPLVEFRKPIDQGTPKEDDVPLLHMKRKSKKSGQTIEAVCKQTPDGFVVLRNSKIELIDSDSIPPGIKEARQKANIDENSVLQEDVFFRSPSYTASFVIGGHANGLVEWKNEDGKTLKDIENESV